MNHIFRMAGLSDMFVSRFVSRLVSEGKGNQRIAHETCNCKFVTFVFFHFPLPLALNLETPFPVLIPHAPSFSTGVALYIAESFSFPAKIQETHSFQNLHQANAVSLSTPSGLFLISSTPIKALPAIF